MFKTDNQKRFSQVLKEFSDVTIQRFDSHAYTAAYYESLMTEMLKSLQPISQETLINDMIRAVDRQRSMLAQENSMKEMA